MTATRLQLPFRNADTSVFASIHNAILATGIVQTSDTGQLSMASAPTYSSTSGNLYGYTVYKFNDAAQSTFPIFFKIKWQNSAVAAAKNFVFPISVGTASDGAGTITSAGGASNSSTVVTDLAFMFGNASSSATTTLFDTWISGDGSGFNWMQTPWDSASGNQGFVSIDRFRNSDGTANARGFQLTNTTASSSMTTRIWNSTTSNFTSVSGMPCWVPWFNNTPTQDGTDIPIFPVTNLSPKLERQLMIVGMNSFDIGAGTVFQATHLGSTHTFMGWGTKFTGGAYINGAVTNGTFAFLYE